jgi:hypothetical protein
MKSNPRLIGAMKRVLTLAIVLLATAVCSKADVLKLWQGTYTTSTTWGAMEMITTGEASKQKARIRFTLDGRPADVGISQLKLSATTVSFLARLAGRQYQFAGARRNNQWEGALAATGSLNDKGTWRLAYIDLRNAAANAEAPLPMPTGRYSIGRVVFHWVDETRPELETRAPSVSEFLCKRLRRNCTSAGGPAETGITCLIVTQSSTKSIRSTTRRRIFCLVSKLELSSAVPMLRQNASAVTERSIWRCCSCSNCLSLSICNSILAHSSASRARRSVNSSSSMTPV